MSNLAKRIIFGVLGGALLIFLLSFSQFTFLGFVLILNVLGLLEFYTVYGIKKNFIVGFNIVLSSFLIFSSYLTLEDYIPFRTLFLLIPLYFLIFIFQLFRNEENLIHKLSSYFLSVIYITLPLMFFMHLAYYAGNFNAHIPLGTLFLIWANDSGAYFVGKFFGRTKLFERISPKKTWEGSVGGFAASLVVAFFLSKYWVELSTWSWFAVAFVTTFFGGIGDLVESMMKRNLDIKDSGNLIPGHGGILDRFDALLIAAPFVFLVLSYQDLLNIFESLLIK